MASAEDCARELASEIRAELGASPDAIVLFASPALDLNALLAAIQRDVAPKLLIGCSSAGEFAEKEFSEGAASALALRSDEIAFGVSVGRGIKRSPEAAAQELTSSLGTEATRYSHRYMLLLTDALAGYTEEFLSKVNELTAGSYQIFGGGAGDDAKFQSTFVFNGTEVLQDAAVALSMWSNVPLGIGVRHGWEPLEQGMRATETEGFELISLNAEPAFDVLLRHAESTGQRFDRENPLPFFLHNVLGVSTPAGFKIRVPLGVTERGGILCATEIPLGAMVHIMETGGSSATEAAGAATETALAQLGGREPAGVLFFDCVATRLRLGTGFGEELAAVRGKTSPAAFVGCNSYGQVARVDGQFSGFHNCTAVVCVIPS